MPSLLRLKIVPYDTLRLCRMLLVVVSISTQQVIICTIRRLVNIHLLKYLFISLTPSLWRGQGEALHPFGHFDAEEAHAVLDDLGHVLGYDEAHGLLLLVGLIEDRVVVIELVEHLRELIAVVGDTRG